ncbi:DUF982 domain-containing protein [Kaistia sp. UC242_56]|uniref:DUF982 domain-containing protein n=1 Tax=Kaistia sp. UC242_56 TaxID=3374625 RepID=UPI0037BA78B7
MLDNMGDEFKPVHVWITAGTTQVVGDVVRAAEMLLKHWPVEFANTDLHNAARLACLEAWQDDGEISAARDTFHAAAQEAGILAPEEVRPTRGTDPRRRRVPRRG